MIKKLILILILILGLLQSQLLCYAAPASSEYESLYEKYKIYDASPKTTKQTVLEITRPQGGSGANEGTSNKFYAICGLTEYDDVRIKVLICKDSTSKDSEYVDFKDTSNEPKSTWDIGSNANGFFAKEFELNEGVNKIRVVAFRKYSRERDFFQISNFTINVINAKNRVGIYDFLNSWLLDKR